MSELEAIGVVPGRQGFRTVGRALEAPGARTVECSVLAVGCCVTDALVMNGRYGEPPPGHEDLVAGHEVVVRAEAILGDDVAAVREGNVYVLTVREAAPGAPAWVRRDPDLADAHYVERGLLRLDGGLRARLRCDEAAMVAVPPGLDPVNAVFLEPASCVCKAFRILTACREAVRGGREETTPRRALVLGAGATGLLAAALFRQEGYDVVTLDLLAPDTVKARLAVELGASYRVNESADAGFVAELHRERGPFRFLFDTTGVPEEVHRWEACLDPTGVTMEFGIPDEPCSSSVDLGEAVVRHVMGTRARVGSVNAGREDWPAALRLIEGMASSCPQFFVRSVRRIDGLAVAEMEDAIRDDAVIKPVVCPNGVAAAGMP